MGKTLWCNTCKHNCWNSNSFVSNITQQPHPDNYGAVIPTCEGCFCISPASKVFSFSVVVNWVASIVANVANHVYEYFLQHAIENEKITNAGEILKVSLMWHDNS